MPKEFSMLSKSPDIGAYVLVKFEAKPKNIFVALITNSEDEDGDVEVK